MAEEAGGEAVDEVARGGAPYRLRLVAHDPTAYDWYYNVIANPMLWFIQHYLWGLASAPDVDHGLHHAWNEGYVAVNQGFADAVVAELERQPDAAVFFHDYHLYVAPGARARAGPRRADGALRARPVADARLLARPPGADPARDPRGPARQRRRQLPHAALAPELPALAAWTSSASSRTGPPTRSRSTAIARACARGRSRSTPASSTSSRRARPCWRPRPEIEAGRPERLILRVDRTDPSKNVVRGFRAYELYLDAHPEMHGRVQMLALLDPSRQDIPEYAEYLGAIQRAARVVNDRFQREGWVPLDLQIQDNFPQAVAAYKQFDVLLVNAIFDGMNLVAKEAPLVNVRDGVLVLSENAGAHDELGEWALTVNPFDVAGPGRGDPRGADDGGGGAPPPARGDRRPRAGARHRPLDRGPARRPRRGARPARSVNEGLTRPGLST